MTNKLTYFGAFVGGLAALAILLAFAPQLYATITARYGPAGSPSELQYIPLLSATTTTATSTNDGTGGGYAKLSGAKKVTFEFSRGDTTGTGNSGQSKFIVQATDDGSTWTDVSRLLLATSTSRTSFASAVFLNGTSTAFASLDIEDDAFLGVRCVVHETTDGEHTCIANVQF